MAVAKWCVLNGAGQVTNVILWDQVVNPSWAPPAGQTVVAYDATLPLAPLPLEIINEQTVRNVIANAMQSNRTYRAITSPTAAQQTAQIDNLTRQILGLERIALGQFDGNG